MAWFYGETNGVGDENKEGIILHARWNICASYTIITIKFTKRHWTPKY